MSFHFDCAHLRSPSWAAMDRTLRPLPPPIFGFCPGRQPLDIAGCISTALPKATEWQQPLYVISMDVK